MQNSSIHKSGAILLVGLHEVKLPKSDGGLIPPGLLLSGISRSERLKEFRHYWAKKTISLTYSY